ncbi:hypothetical protein NEOC95_001828 [Neochlamydia sp. AcF95]|nr:hypothetical protein [Neochlamydia sp. AcF95]
MRGDLTKTLVHTVETAMLTEELGRGSKNYRHGLREENR